MENNRNVTIENLKRKYLLKEGENIKSLLDSYTLELMDLLKIDISQEIEYKTFFENLNISHSMPIDCFVFWYGEELTFAEGLNEGAVSYDELCDYDGRLYPPNTAMSVKDILNSMDNEFDLTLIDKNGEHKAYGRLNKENVYKTCHDLILNGENSNSIAIFNLKDSMSIYKYVDMYNL